MNIEHPMFIAGVHQGWICDNAGKPLYWPVNNYFLPDGRSTDFLGLRHASNTIILTQILMGLLRSGFALRAVEEAQSPKEMIDLPGMADELRRPMMLLIKADKQ